MAVQYGEQPAAALRLAGLDPAEVPAAFWLADDLPGPHRVVLRLLDTPDGLLAGVAHHPDALDGPGARRWVSRLAALLAGAHDESPEPVVMSEDEHRRVVLAPNATAVDLGAPATVHDLVAEQARRTPDRTALVFAGAEVGYAELDARANRLAHELRERGVRRETPVAVCLERETGLVVALLAVLKAGGAFVPLDPQYPRQRLAHMLADSGAAVVLTQGRLRDRFAADGPPVLVTDDDATRFAHHPSSAPPASSGPDDLAYVVYTSGSTGRPKGVMVEHRGIASYLRGMQHDFPLTPEDRVLQATSLSFDVSVYEIFWPLQVGAAVVLPAPGGHTDPYHLSELIQRHGVTCLHFVPSLMRLFVEEADPGAGAGLRRVFVSGEALDPSLVALVHERTSAELVNLYGATEVSVDSTYWTADRAKPDRPVLVGRPMANATAYVLDQRLRPKPAGVVGEVFLGGASVTRGYHARPALTAERFVPDPFGPPGSRLYRTGDLGRVTPDGELEFLGRRDHQFKLRGWRVEAGEIEAAITAHPGVNGAVVVTEGAHEHATLLAYVGADAGLDQAALREFLARRLPRPLVPARFIRLDRLPISPNGKVDRAALPKPDQAPAEPAPTTAAPPTHAADGRPALEHAADGRPALERGSDGRPVLEVVLAVAAEVLGAPIGPEDSFFGSGGNSIQATRLAARLRAALRTDVPVRLAFEAPTPAAMAALLSPPSPSPSPRSPGPSNGSGCSAGSAATPPSTRSPWRCAWPARWTSPSSRTPWTRSCAATKACGTSSPRSTAPRRGPCSTRARSPWPRRRTGRCARCSPRVSPRWTPRPAHWPASRWSTRARRTTCWPSCCTTSSPTAGRWTCCCATSPPTTPARRPPPPAATPTTSPWNGPRSRTAPWAAPWSTSSPRWTACPTRSASRPTTPAPRNAPGAATSCATGSTPRRSPRWPNACAPRRSRCCWRRWACCCTASAATGTWWSARPSPAGPTPGWTTWSACA
nr:hypothetical protein GCM10017745_38880 [Saccharothrix mutabilis subsp. capreolus]